ncbi:MAG: serine hydrolase domain-containing protein [Ilumatobacteraceae bacterium]
MPSDPLDLVATWPVDHVAAAVVTPDGVRSTVGDEHRRFRLASLTKPMTAWATLVAVEEGVVGLDDDVGQPGCTLRHLLAHAGGYGFEGTEPTSPPERSRIYSNTGYELLADHVATAAAMPFDHYLLGAVFEPLGMGDAELTGSPAHAVHATVGDVAAFVVELLHPRLLAAETATDACSPQYPQLAGIVPGVGRFTPCPWGLGVEIAGEKHPHWSGSARSSRAVGHFGGAGTMMLADPDAAVGVVALTDRPFDQWAADALRAWSELSDAAVASADRPDGQGR